jgi:hypothetical protein
LLNILKFTIKLKIMAPIKTRVNIPKEKLVSQYIMRILKGAFCVFIINTIKFFVKDILILL